MCPQKLAMAHSAPAVPSKQPSQGSGTKKATAVTLTPRNVVTDNNDTQQPQQQLAGLKQSADDARTNMNKLLAMLDSSSTHEHEGGVFVLDDADENAAVKESPPKRGSIKPTEDASPLNVNMEIVLQRPKSPTVVAPVSPTTHKQSSHSLELHSNSGSKRSNAKYSLPGVAVKHHPTHQTSHLRTPEQAAHSQQLKQAAQLLHTVISERDQLKTENDQLRTQLDDLKAQLYLCTLEKQDLVDQVELLNHLCGQSSF
jgi:hypothetical protein